MDGMRGESEGRSRRSVLRTLGVAGAGVAGVSVSPDLLTGSAAAQTDQPFSTTDVTIDSFDGTEIAATVYVPDGEGPHPSVLTTHGWGGNRQSLVPIATKYVTNGYVVLAYDSRGFGESGGEVTSTGPNEVGDAMSLISWLADHDTVATDAHGDPQVGMDGGSYGGGIQFRTAAADDRLDAIVPRITWHDLPEAYAPNDVLKMAWARALASAGEAGGRIHPEIERMSEEVISGGEITDEFEAFYRSRSPTSYLHEVETPTLVVHSWYDRLFTPDQAVANFRGLQRRGVEAGLVLQDGGGHHLGDAPSATAAEQAFVEDATLSWMEAHVGGDGDHSLPPVSLYDDSSDSFVTADRFPPADVADREFDFATEGTVRLGDPSGGESRSDGDRTVATFDVELDEETEIMGSAELEAFVVPRGSGTLRLAVALQHVSDGTAETIKDQITPVEIERPTRLDLDLFPVHGVLAAGDRLRLAIATQDERVDDVAIPPQISDTGLYVDADEGAGAVLPATGRRGPTLSVPVRGAGGDDSRGWWG